MRLRWEGTGTSTRRGFSVDDGTELAQIANVFSPDGDNPGWIVLLTQQQGELFEHYPTPEEAMAAAEAALDT